MGQCILRDCGVEFEKLKGKKKEQLEIYLKERLVPYRIRIHSQLNSRGEEYWEENQIAHYEAPNENGKARKSNEQRRAQNVRLKSASKKSNEAFKEDGFEREISPLINQPEVNPILKEEIVSSLEENEYFDKKERKTESSNDSFEIKNNEQSQEDFDFRPKTKTAVFGAVEKNTQEVKKDDALNEHVVVLQSSDGFKKKNIQLNMSTISDKSHVFSSKHQSNNVSREEIRKDSGTIFDKMNQNLKKSLTTKRKSAKDSNSPLSNNSKNNTSQRSNNLLDSLHEDQNAKQTYTWTEKKTAAGGTIKEYQKGFPNVVFQVLEKETETPSRNHHTEAEYGSIFNDDDYNSDNSDAHNKDSHKDYVALRFPEHAKSLKK